MFIIRLVDHPLGTAEEGFLDEDGFTAHRDVRSSQGASVITLERAGSPNDASCQRHRSEAVDAARVQFSGLSIDSERRIQAGGGLPHSARSISKGKQAIHSAAGNKFLCLVVAQRLRLVQPGEKVPSFYSLLPCRRRSSALPYPRHSNH